MGGSVSSRHRRKDEQRSQQLRGNGKDLLSSGGRTTIHFGKGQT
jgi:hypothetical protein